MTLALLAMVALFAAAAYEYTKQPVAPEPARKAPQREISLDDLKKELDFGPVDWVGCQEPSLEATGAKDDEATSYGVLKGVQRRLAALRTDLDSFSEAEAFALMTSGYLMMGRELAARRDQSDVGINKLLFRQ